MWSRLHQAGLDKQHDAEQSALALEQRHPVRSSPSIAQHIERIVRPLAAEQQLLEVGAAVRVQAADLAVQPGVVANKAQR
jgi:hypothetical protein